MRSDLDYLKLYQQLHDAELPYLVDGKQFPPTNKLFDGSNFVTKLLPQFDLVMKHKQGAVRILDYGCGKAEHLFSPTIKGKTLYQAYPSRIQTYYCFDPGYRKFAKPPHTDQTFDIIICADVMEHVPGEEAIKRTLNDMAYQLEPDGVALFTISGKPAKKQFLDGENLHVSQFRSKVWFDFLSSAFEDKAFYIMYEGFTSTVLLSNDSYKSIASS